MFKTKKILIALAVIGANVLHNMPVHTAFADNVSWYGKSGNTWTTNQSSAATSGLALTLTPSSTAESGSWADVNYFYGGYNAASATVSGNTLTINAGTYTSNNGASDFFAGFSDLGVVSGNILTLNSANFTTGIHLEAGNANGNGNVSGNIVNINNSTFGGNFEANGGSSSGLTSTTLSNAVNITDSTFNGTATICGSRTASGNTTSGTVSVTDSTFNGNTEIYGNSSSRGNVSGGNIIIDNDVFHNQTAICGGYQKFDEYSAGGNVSGGSVTVKEYTCFYGDTNIFGSYAGGGDRGTGGGNASGGEVTIDYAYFRDGSSVEICGGFGMDTASGNKVTINDIEFNNITNCYISAGMAGSEISGNELTINGGDFTGVKILSILGGNGDTATMSNNIITINGGKFSSDSTKVFYIYAGDSGAGTGTGNVLNINTCVDGIVNEIYNPQTINFKAPSGMDTNLPMLNLRNAVALAGVNISADVSKISLAADDFITLIDNVDGTDYTPADAHYQVLTIDNSRYFLVYSGSTDPITVEPDVVVNAGATPYNSGKSKGVYYDVFNGTDLTSAITGNEMDIAGGTYKSEVYGAGAIKDTGSHTVSNNTVNIEDGTFISENLRKSFDIWTDTVKIAGGYGNSSGDASITVTNNTLNILGGEFTRSDFHDYYLAGGILDNEVADATLVASGNTLNVSGGTFNTEDGKFINFSGTYVYSKCKAENVTITGSTVVFGAEDSKISVTEDSWTTIYGARFGEKYTDVKSNNVTISNNNVSIVSDTDKASKITVYGGFAWDCEHFTAENNVVNIGKSDGSTVFENMKFSEIYGADAVWGVNDKTLTGNTLNLNAKISVTEVVKNFQNMNFTLPAGFGASDVMMTVDGTVYFDNTVVDINDSLPDGFVVVKGSTITLISANELSGEYTVGDNVVALGTLKLEDNKLYISLLEGPIVAKDLTVDVQVNSGDALVLIGNDADNILTKTISGEGGVQIGNGTDAAEVKTSADNLAVADDIVLQTNAILTITDGALAQNVDSSGTVNMAESSSFGTGGKITGGDVTLGTGVEFSKDNLSGTGTLNLDNAVYNLSATLDGSTITLDQIDATNISGTLSLGDITLSGSGLIAGTTYQASYITGTATTLTVNGTSAVTYDGQTYIFSQGYNTAGDSSTGEKAGTLDILVEGRVYTLKEIINGNTSAGFDPAKIDTYVMTEDYTATEDLGVLGKATGATARTLTVDGDETYKLLGNGQNGITVSTGDTLTLQDIAEISGWNTYAVDNSGTVNFAGTVTLGTDAVMQGAGAYNNNDTLETSANNLQMTNGLANNGTLILKDGTLTAGITGTGTITIDGNVTTADPSKLGGSTGTLAVLEDGILELTGSTLDKVIANEGTVKLNGAGLGSACVTTGTLEFAQNLIINADYVAAEKNVVDEGITLTLTDGSLAKEVTGAGGITFGGNVSADADYIKTEGINTVDSGKTLTLTSDGTGDDTLTVAIGGDGSIVFAGNVSTNAEKIQTTGGGTVTTGTLHLTGGVLDAVIGGAGDIYIDGDVSSNAANLQGDKMTVSDSNTLTLTAGTLDKAVTNNGTIKLDGATLGGKYVTDGTLEFAQDLSINADYVAADANVVDNGVILTLTEGSLAEEVTGTGGITFGGDVSADADNIKTTGTNKVESGKILTLTDGTLGSAITNEGTVKLDGATLGGKYVTDGTLEFAADLSINADYIGEATNKVDSDVTLTFSSGSLTGNITNSGTVAMATGSSFGDGGKITGGAVTLGEGVEFTESNFEDVTSLALTNAVYNLSATVVDGGVTVSQLPACATGTITLGDITIDGANYESWAEGDYKQIQFADLSTNNLTVSGSQEVILDDYVYTFSQAYNTAGDSSSGIKYGYFDVIKEIAETRTLKEVIAQDDGDIKYSLRADENVDGTIELRDSSASDPRTLTVKNSGSNTYEIVAQNDDAVLKNNNADTLALENVTVSGFDTAIENATANGTVNLKSVTFENTGTTDVVNDGTLNILDGNVTFDKGVTGTGTTNVKGNLTVGASTTIEQNTINIDTGKILTNNGTITVNNGSLNGDGTTPLTNAGTVVINNGNLNTIVDGGVLEFDGTSSVEKAEYIAGDTNRIRSNASLKLANETEGELKAILEGDGEVIIDSAIDATNGEIKTKVTVNTDKSLTIYADKLGNVTTNNGTLNLMGGTGDDGRTLSYEVNGTGKTVITGGSSGAEWTVTANVPINSSGGITVEQYNTLQISASNIGAEVTNNGTIKLAGASGDSGETLNHSITGGILDVVSGVYDFTDTSKISNVDTIKLTDGTIIMDAEDLFTTDYAGKTDFGNKLTAGDPGGTLNLNNFDGKETFTSEEYKAATTALDNSSIMLVISGELALADGETLVIKGTGDGNGNVALSGVTPTVVDTGTGSDEVDVPAVPSNYVPVTDHTATNLLKADTITVDGGSKFIAKGLQIDDLQSASTLDLVISGDGTDLTLTGGVGETGVVKKDSNDKVPVSLTVKDGAVFNAGMAAAGSNKNDFEFTDITINNAKMNVVGNNVSTSTLTIEDGGWLVVDPSYVYSDTLNIMGGAIQVVPDGAVYNQGYNVAQLRDYVERAGVSTTTQGDGFIVSNGIGIMALKNSNGGVNITLDKNNGSGGDGDHLAISADSAYNPDTAPMLKIDSGSLLILEGSKGQDSSIPAIIDLKNSRGEIDISISDDAKVFVAGVNAKGVGIYKLLHGNGIDKAGNYFGGHIYTDNPLYKIALLLPEEQIDDTFGFKLTWNEANSAFSVENLGVTRGAYDVMSMAGNAITTHFDTKEPGEKLWGTFVHNKDKVDGLAIGNTTAKYDAQFNGTIIGYDLVDDHDIIMGLALGYVNGNTTNGTGHNDSKYNSIGVYGRKNIDGIQLQGDITYLYGKNETENIVDETSIRADAKTDTYTIGIRAEKPYAAGKGTVAPFAGLRYLRINGRDYSNNLGMKFSTDNLNSVVVPLGVNYKMTVDNFYGWKVKPEVGIGYVFNLGNKDSRINVTHEKVGSSYEFDVLDKSAFFAKAGMSFSKKNFTASVGYDYMKGSHSHNNRWNVNMNWSF